MIRTGVTVVRPGAVMDFIVETKIEADLWNIVAALRGEGWILSGTKTLTEGEKLDELHNR